MGRLIDADALYKSFGATGNCNDCPLDAYKCQYYNEHTLMEFCERIDDAPTVFSEADLIEIEDRFGYYVRAIIEDMISGENNRWSTKWCEETLDIKRN